MLDFAIVEDDDAAASALTGFIGKYCEDNKLAYHVSRFGSATDLLKSYTPIYDIIFMDIMLPNLNGMEAAKRLREFDASVVLIFVTNMANFAVKGYEVDALDFIIKPVVYDSFVMKIKKAINIACRSKSVGVKVQLDGSIRLIPSAKIYFVEVSRHNLIIHTEDGDVNTRGTISGMEKQLVGENFARCNVCFLVNMRFITAVDSDNITMFNGEQLKISRARKKEFMLELTNFLGKNV